MFNKQIRFLVFILLFNFKVSVCLSQELKAVLKDMSFDKKTGIISYELAAPAYVRIRIGIADGPLYRTICDWQERGIGKHKEEWDGMDPSGKFKLVGREDLVFTFHYFTAGDEYLRDIQVADVLSLSGSLAGRHLPNLQTNQMHKSHHRQFCREAKINIYFPKDTPQSKDGSYSIKDKTAVEIVLSDEDKTWFRAERYSMHIFVDDVFVIGELDGYSPYTWIFDPQGINKGKHLIVVNLAGFADHYGIAAIPVMLE